MSRALKHCKPAITLKKRSRLPIQHQSRPFLPLIGCYSRPLISHLSSSHNSVLSRPDAIRLRNPKESPLSLLSTKVLLRSFLISFVSTSSILFPLSLQLLSLLVRSKSLLFNPDRNRILHYVLKQTFYAQFCAGETPAEVKKTVDGLKAMGCDGVILCYAKEAVIEGEGSRLICTDNDGSRDEVDRWKEGTLETVKLAERGDYVAVKYVTPY